MNWKAWTLAMALIFSGSLYAQMEGEDDLEKQIDAEVAKYDTDKDGKITKAEYRAALKKENNVEDEATYDWLDMWKYSLIDFLAADADDNIEVTKAELMTYYQRIQGGEAEKMGTLTKKDITELDNEYLEPIVKWMLDTFDGDKNGKISQKEGDAQKIGDVVKEYDTNKDGNLDGMEIKVSEVAALKGLYDIEEGYTLKGEASTAEKPDPSEISEKIREAFASMDPDKDGSITKAEMRKVSTNDQQLKSEWWGIYLAFLSIDGNDDNTVDINEFNSYAQDEQNGVKHKLYPSDVAEGMNEIWSELDSDKDGKITKAEWEKLFPGNDEFAGLDADSSGDVTKVEMWDALKSGFTEKFEFPEKDRAAGTADNGGTPNPDDPMWALYKKEGRSWTTKNVSKYMGIENVSYTKTEVIKVAADHCIVKYTALDKDKKPYAGMAPTETKIEFKTSAGGTSDNAATIKDLGTETIKVEAGEFECQVSEVTVEVAGTKYTTKSWTSKKHAGLSVKSESSSTGASSSSELVEYKD